MTGFSLRMAVGVSRRPPSRQEVESRIERLISYLDTLDGDPDFKEAGDDEPSLGWSHTYALGRPDDLEEGRI